MEERRQAEEPPPPEETPGGPFYGELIREALAEERTRKDSLERRGASMVTASAFLSAFVLSLLGFTFENIGQLPAFETGAVWVALSGFVLSAMCGLAANWPVGYSEPKVNWLEKINNQAYWDNSQQMASGRVNESRLMTLASYRKINGRKAAVLTAALVLETVGIGALAVLILALIS